jgi:hypothetical protein
MDQLMIIRHASKDERMKLLLSHGRGLSGKFHTSPIKVLNPFLRSLAASEGRAGQIDVSPQLPGRADRRFQPADFWRCDRPDP